MIGPFPNLLYGPTMPRRTSPDPSDNLATLVSLLRTHTDRIADDLYDRLAEQLPAYRQLPRPRTVRELAANIDLVLEACTPGVPAPRPVRLRAARDVGAERARQGFALDDLLRGWRIGLEVTYEHADRLVDTQPVPDSVLGDFTRALLHASDIANIATAEGHRQIELAAAVASAEWRARLVQAVLFGEGDEQSPAADLALLGFNTDTPLRAFCTANDSDHSLRDILAWLEPRQRNKPPAGIAAAVGPHVIGLLRDPAPAATAPAPIGAGPVSTDLPSSLRTARRVLSAARAAGLSGLNTADELGLLLPIVSDVDVGDALVRRYVAPFQRTQSGREVLATVRAYLDTRQHIDQVARNAFVHTNTVRYRLRRFEQVTKADLRSPWSLAEVCWALRRADLAAPGTGAGPTREA
jgi:hypothetical protein